MLQHQTTHHATTPNNSPCYNTKQLTILQHQTTHHYLSLIMSTNKADSDVFARATEEKDNTYLTCPQLPLPHPHEFMDLFHTFTVKNDYSDLTLLWSKLLQIVKSHPHTTVLAHPQKWSLVCVSWKFVSMAKVVICLFQNNTGGDGNDNSNIILECHRQAGDVSVANELYRQLQKEFKGGFTSGSFPPLLLSSPCPAYKGDDMYQSPWSMDSARNLYDMATSPYIDASKEGVVSLTTVLNDDVMGMAMFIAHLDMVRLIQLQLESRDAVRICCGIYLLKWALETPQASTFLPLLLCLKTWMKNPPTSAEWVEPFQQAQDLLNHVQ